MAEQKRRKQKEIVNRIYQPNRSLTIFDRVFLNNLPYVIKGNHLQSSGCFHCLLCFCAFVLVMMAGQAWQGATRDRHGRREQERMEKVGLQLLRHMIIMFVI